MSTCQSVENKQTISSTYRKGGNHLPGEKSTRFLPTEEGGGVNDISPAQVRRRRNRDKAMIDHRKHDDRSDL